MSMARKKKAKEKIPVEELLVGGTYKTYTGDLVEVRKIDETAEVVTLRNITKSFNLWLPYKHVYLVEKVF